ncbi:HET-domain-containing protein [Acephala macrosclerotiorum]|nr:HET-domain-containing protein [Acephala macrosclerotiorum]
MIDVKEKNQLHIFGPYPEDIVTLLIVAESGSYPEPLFSISGLALFQVIPLLNALVEGSALRKLRSDQVYESARAIINDCRRHHGICGERTTTVLPTRVLDLEPESGVAVRLYEPREGELGGYIALSYCWGEAQPEQTTKQTLSGELQEIDKAILPQSIQDAIFVTRKLGHRYHWVDSLYIIQDSDEDKITEIPV